MHAKEKTNKILAPKKTSFEHTLKWISHPFDFVRLRLFQFFTPWITPLIQNRSLRICVSACILFFASFVFSLTVPLWQLLLGPILLGIPHIIGDIRYLVIREKLHQKLCFWVAVALPFLLYMTQAKPHYAMLGVLAAALFSKRILWEKAFVIALCSILLYISWKDSRNFLFAFLHMHNLVGIAIWWKWKKKRKLWESIPLFLCLLGCIIILFVPLPLHLAAEYFPPHLDSNYFQQNLTDFAPIPYQFRLVMLYAFLQSIHYVIWIRLIPEEERKQPTPRTFHRSLIALKKDFGSILVCVTFLSMILLAIYTLYNPKMARHNYLYLISFHGFLELAFCAYTKIKS